MSGHLGSIEFSWGQKEIHKWPRDAISNENTFLNIHEYTSETTELLNYSLKATLSIWSNQISLITCGVNASFVTFKLFNHYGIEKPFGRFETFSAKKSIFRRKMMILDQKVFEEVVWNCKHFPKTDRIYSNAEKCSQNTLIWWKTVIFDKKRVDSDTKCSY